MTYLRNTFATPLVIKAYKLHESIFKKVYPFPLKIYFHNGQISVKVNKILQYKHIPFLISLLIVTVLLGSGSCLLQPLLKLLQRNSNITVIQLVFCSYFGFCSFLEWGMYTVYSKSMEMSLVFNQLLAIEINRKQKYF